MPCFPQKSWHKCVCPQSPGASGVICQVTIQLHSMQLFHMVHGAVIPAQTSSALCSLLSASLQYFELSFKSTGRNFWAGMNLYALVPFLPAPRAARTWCIQYQYPCSTGGLNYIPPPLYVSQVTGTLLIDLCPLGHRFACTGGECCSSTQASCLLAEERSMMCAESPLPDAK